MPRRNVWIIVFATSGPETWTIKLTWKKNPVLLKPGPEAWLSRAGSQCLRWWERWMSPVRCRVAAHVHPFAMHVSGASNEAFVSFSHFRDDFFFPYWKLYTLNSVLANTLELKKKKFEYLNPIEAGDCPLGLMKRLSPRLELAELRVILFSTVSTHASCVMLIRKHIQQNKWMKAC